MAARQLMSSLSISTLPHGLQSPAAAAAGDLAGGVGGEHPFGEHPSRTLFVRNINWSVEETEIRALFEAYGEVLF